MTTEIYLELAEVLNKIPNGYPAVESGAHLRLLEWIFTQEEAEIASQLKLRGETIEELSNRLQRETESLQKLLEVMVENGQIRGWTSRTGRKYALLPFVVGIFEEQLGRMDEEFAQRFEAYIQEGGFKGLTSASPSIGRVIPVNSTIKTELEIHPYQKAEEMIRNAKSWGLRECVCKKQKGLIGEPCNYPTTVCLIFSPRRENAYDDDHLTKPITMEEALQALRDAEEAGLVHCTLNLQTGQYFICNCCTCCCAILRGVDYLEDPGAFVKSDYIVSVDEELCVGCGTCVERCQFEALRVPGDICEVELKRCIGCGVCTITCPEGALSLIDRDPEEKSVPPESNLDWMTQRAKTRGIDPSELL